MGITARACQSTSSRPKCRDVNSAFSENSDQIGLRCACWMAVSLLWVSVGFYHHIRMYLHTGDPDKQHHLRKQSLIKCLGPHFKSSSSSVVFGTLLGSPSSEHPPPLRPPSQHSCSLHQVLPLPALMDAGISLTRLISWVLLSGLVKEGRQWARSRIEKDIHFALFTVAKDTMFVSMKWILKHCPSHYKIHANLFEEHNHNQEDLPKIQRHTVNHCLGTNDGLLISWSFGTYQVEGFKCEEIN